jgi:DNA-directed RNA polymerase specialized sigma24 family protein
VTLRASDEEGILRAAFRDAHGARLNGFALLVTLGDQALSASLAADALGEGTLQADVLRHPERAAAWLRARVLKSTPRRVSRRRAPTDEERMAALAAIGVDGLTYRTLASLTVEERAALVASSLEGFAALDMEEILGSGARDARRRVSEARTKFFERHVASKHAMNGQIGPLGSRVSEIVDQALTRNRR